ncbi:tripartite tricarboxylate transporter substrate binding protein [Aquincola tertiaricarbonis]|uniref:Tripartite tricarboxylate transporter substrate binding protein n=1 Tax=Aquincola tertiaricarbonis TaxID=391953 RepID=A0ABY4S0W1_AQUTE|nr:tripartite tricarboxylate transporter substrate binding protein [Aquincola tertiaricarbonis]URI07006.1 tripartite tricarboxylate transporter substrate binding protein [Aquincola tertiaricarbonis]
MKTPRGAWSRRQALVGLGALLGLDLAVAQGYPARPVRLVVPAPSGTSPDVMARAWGDAFSRATSQPVLVDNKPGASTMIAAQAVAGAPADGYNLLYTFNNTFSINPWVFKKMPYKADDFAPVSRLLSVPYVLLVSSESRIRSLQDLVAEARSHPGTMNYASAGIGSGFHVVMARLLNAAGVRMTHVPYKDYFLTDLMAQRIDVAFDASTSAIPQVRAGKLRALAVSSARRIDALPEVPAITETYPGFVGDSWHGLFAPRGTPAAVLAALEAQSQRIVAAPEFQARLREVSLTPVGSSAEQFRQFLAADAQAWGKVVRDNDIRLD